MANENINNMHDIDIVESKESKRDERKSPNIPRNALTDIENEENKGAQDIPSVLNCNANASNIASKITPDPSLCEVEINNQESGNKFLNKQENTIENATINKQSEGYECALGVTSQNVSNNDNQAMANAHAHDKNNTNGKHEIMQNKSSENQCKKIQSSNRSMKISILEILIAIAILFIRIATDHRNASEYFDKAKVLNANALSNKDKVDINKRISIEINENEGEVPSVKSSQTNKIKGDIPIIRNINAKHIKNIRNSTFVGAMIFAQRKAAPNKLKHTKGNNKHIQIELWLKAMNINEILKENDEINDYNIRNIKVHKGAEAEAKFKECFEIPIMKSTINNNSNYMHQYDMPFKERLKLQIKESHGNCCILPSVLTIILIVLIKIMLMDFKAFDFDEDEDMHQKKVYDDVSHCADTVEDA